MVNRTKKPKRRPSGFNLFVRDCMGKSAPNLKGKPFGTAAPFMKKCTREWGSFSESQKGAYKQKSNACQLDEVLNKWNCPT